MWILPELFAISGSLKTFPSLQPKYFFTYMLNVEERNGKIFELRSISKTSLRDKVRASKCRNGSVLDIV